MFKGRQKAKRHSRMLALHRLTSSLRMNLMAKIGVMVSQCTGRSSRKARQRGGDGGGMFCILKLFILSSSLSTSVHPSILARY